MADTNIDAACDAEQRDRDLAIAVVRLQKTPVTIYHTHCKWCGDPTEGGKKFCSYGHESCAIDSSLYERTLRRTGVAR